MAGKKRYDKMYHELRRKVDMFSAATGIDIENVERAALEWADLIREAESLLRGVENVGTQLYRDSRSARLAMEQGGIAAKLLKR